MSEIKAIIAEDEKAIREYLKNEILEVWPDLDICGEASNGIEAIGLVEICEPDIAFLDINMPGLSGLEVAQKIVGRCRIVFITAYDQYAVEAFESEAIDYLVKPVTRERLSKTIKRLQDILSNPTPMAENLQQVLSTLLETKPDARSVGYLQWIRAQSGQNIRVIPVDSVCYFMASEKYTVVKTATEEVVIRKTIKELCDELDPEKFWQIHRSTIVNANTIQTVSRSFSGRYVVKLNEISETLTVSRTYAHLFKQM
jgi:DNA-binding LytR/AlgR family response regulator